MQGEIQQEQWQAYLDDFSKRNSDVWPGSQLLASEISQLRAGSGNQSEFALNDLTKRIPRK